MADSSIVLVRDTRAALARVDNTGQAYGEDGQRDNNNNPEEPPLTMDAFLQREDVWVGGIFPFLGMGHYRFVGAVNTQMNQAYKSFCNNVSNPPQVLQLPPVGAESLDGYMYRPEYEPATATDTIVSAAFANDTCVALCHSDFSPRDVLPDSDFTSPCVALPDWVSPVIAGPGNARLLRWAIEKGIHMRTGCQKWTSPHPTMVAQQSLPLG